MNCGTAGLFMAVLMGELCCGHRWDRLGI